jgi:uncharacterized membrane protein YGL010W
MIRPITNWLSRHQNPVNFWIHMLGIPLTILAIPLAVMHFWLVAASVFVSGYALQFIGHAVEGNHSGEALLARRLLKLDPPDSAAKSVHRRRRPR